MAAKIITLGNEIVSAFCNECKCCLASTTHCATCHSKKEIKTLCGCGECAEKIQDYLEREQARVARVEANRKARTSIDG